MEFQYRSVVLVLSVIIALVHTKATPSRPLPSIETLQDAMEVFGHESSLLEEQFGNNGWGEKTRSTRASNAQKWLKIISEYAQDAVDDDREGNPDWAPHPIPINLPIVGRNGKQVESLPVLVVPLPVPYPSKCSAHDGEDRNKVEVNRRFQLPVENYPTPVVETVVTGQQLVQLFKEQQPTSPSLRPVEFAVSTNPQPNNYDPFKLPTDALRGTLNIGQNLGSIPRPFTNADGAPPRPVFDRPLKIQAQLTVPRSDYTESYTAWWDPSTGASRVDFYGGATSTIRMMLPNGQLQRVEVKLDRSSGRDVRSCATLPPETPTERLTNPALPNLDNFSFSGYVDINGVRAERWQQTLRGVGGQLGGAEGEALTYTHDMYVTRAGDQATPVRYTVSVDSSVLGAGCDRYEHNFQQVEVQQPDEGLFRVDLSSTCDQVETLLNTPVSIARVEPLREFTMLQRDPRYDQALNEFKLSFGRSYVDNAEEAVRKNLFIQHSRFCNSGNREGATFEMKINFLGDRLDSELVSLFGVVFDAEGIPAEKFPHAGDDLTKLERKLPKGFDWRPKGAVTPVRYQGSCQSCWAFAVVGAVEGALFIKSRRLVPLSEQCLVDCAHKYGGRGCKGTWPSFAYDYIQNEGIPALEEYTAYQEKVLQCKDKQVPPVTHIASHVNVTRNSVPALKIAIRKHAPTVVIVDAKPKSFIFYNKGVLKDDRCDKSARNGHAVLAVGWGEENGVPHFILKNSWSAKWGENGYIRIEAATNTCGVLTLPSYPRLEKDNIDRQDLKNSAASRSNSSEEEN